MFKIYDGRSHFYQWDLDRKLIVEDSTINQVHFCNRTGECSLIREVYDAEGLRLVDVPNVLLQTDWRINVYGYDVNYTKYDATFEVCKRSKPDDYVYTDEEVHHWNELEARIDQIEEQGVSDEKVAAAVTEYLTENPVEHPVESVNGHTGVIELTAADVNALPADTHIPDTTGLASEKYVDDKVAAIPEPDFTGYATEEFVTKKIAEAELAESDVDLSAYYTKSEVDNKIETIELTPGPAGPQGEKGDKGDTGAPGADGKDGAKGDTGPQGPQGEQGPAGKDGANGKDGAQGPQGETGPEGPQGPAGADGKDGYTPVKGVDYFDGAPGKDGADGKDYVLTDADKQEIADMVDVSAPDVDLTNYYTKSEVDNKGYQTADQVTAAINSALGVIENGTY